MDGFGTISVASLDTLEAIIYKCLLFGNTKVLLCTFPWAQTSDLVATHYSLDRSARKKDPESTRPSTANTLPSL